MQSGTALRETLSSSQPQIAFCLEYSPRKVEIPVQIPTPEWGFKPGSLISHGNALTTRLKVIKTQTHALLFLAWKNVFPDKKLHPTIKKGTSVHLNEQHMENKS